MINYLDYTWYIKHPEHKIQIYSVACFLCELDNNPIHQNKIFKKILTLSGVLGWGVFGFHIYSIYFIYSIHFICLFSREYLILIKYSLLLGFWVFFLGFGKILMDTHQHSDEP